MAITYEPPSDSESSSMSSNTKSLPHTPANTVNNVPVDVNPNDEQPANLSSTTGQAPTLVVGNPIEDLGEYNNVTRGKQLMSTMRVTVNLNIEAPAWVVMVFFYYWSKFIQLIVPVACIEVKILQDGTAMKERNASQA